MQTPFFLSFFVPFLVSVFVFNSVLGLFFVFTSFTSIFVLFFSTLSSFSCFEAFFFVFSLSISAGGVAESAESDISL